MEIQEKINALMENEAFVKEFRMVTGAEDVVALFGRHGIRVPLEIAQELLTEPAEEEMGELSEDNLDTVVGGGKYGAQLGSIAGQGIYYGAGYLGARIAGWDKKKAKKYAKNCGKVGSALGGALGFLALPF